MLLADLPRPLCPSGKQEGGPWFHAASDCGCAGASSTTRTGCSEASWAAALRPAVDFVPFFLGGTPWCRRGKSWVQTENVFWWRSKERFGGVMNYVINDATTNRYVPTAFEPRSSGYRQLPMAFEVHSGFIRDAVGTFGQDSKWLAVSILLEWDRNVWNSVEMVEMLQEYLESNRSAVGIHFQCRSIFLHFESTSKVLSMCKTSLSVTRMCPNVWNAHRMH